MKIYFLSHFLFIFRLSISASIRGWFLIWFRLVVSPSTAYTASQSLIMRHTPHKRDEIIDHTTIKYDYSYRDEISNDGRSLKAIASDICRT